jgi:integrase
METQSEVAGKPRLSYNDFVASKHGETVAAYCRRYIMDSEQPGSKEMGASQRYILMAMGRSPIGAVQLTDLKAQHFVDHCRWRIARGVQPQTVKQDVVYLAVVLRHAVQIWDAPESCFTAYVRARPLLVKQRLIGGGQPRTRRPTQDEIDRICAHFDAQAKHKQTRIPMRAIVEFSLLTARRISETCRIRWEDLDTEKRTCIVRDLKNSRGKGFHDVFPLLGKSWDIVMAQPRRDDEPRIFPYVAKSCGAAYTRAKKKLGIKGLRLHDNRRDCISRMFEDGYSVPEVAKLSLHRNPHLLLKVYTVLKAEDLHKGPASKRQSLWPTEKADKPNESWAL